MDAGGIGSCFYNSRILPERTKILCWNQWRLQKWWEGGTSATYYDPCTLHVHSVVGFDVYT